MRARLLAVLALMGCPPPRVAIPGTAGGVMCERGCASDRYNCGLAGYERETCATREAECRASCPGATPISDYSNQQDVGPPKAAPFAIRTAAITPYITQSASSFAKCPAERVTMGAWTELEDGGKVAVTACEQLLECGWFDSNPRHPECIAAPPPAQ